MYEKVNPAHPDKIADRIAGAVVDLAYAKEKNPKIAVEVLIGHDECNIIIEGTKIKLDEVQKIVSRIAGTGITTRLLNVPQDEHLAKNQEGKIRCGDNGIFKGVPLTHEQKLMTAISWALYDMYPTDGKYILDIDNKKIIVCQSQTDDKFLDVVERLGIAFPKDEYKIVVNPLGDWVGGINSDSGATNRKLGSDMGDSMTGGGLFGKDCSKGDVSINIYAYLKAQQTNKPVEISCAIGDEYVDGRPYSEIVDIAKRYISKVGGFEKFAEWGLIRMNPHIDIELK